MATKPTFSAEIANLMPAAHGNPLRDCIQCGTCSGTCPVARFMDLSPRRLIAMIQADRREEVLSSNTYWYCASCYHCTVRCPAQIDIAGLMYALKRYFIWKNLDREGLVGPVFSETFVKMIVDGGRSFEPVLAPAYVFSYGLRGMVQEMQTATGLMLKGRLPLMPPRIKRLKNFRRMISRILPLGGDA